MNPAIGIETSIIQQTLLVLALPFKLMNPAIGIETRKAILLQELPPFKLMNPAIGIETLHDTSSGERRRCFQINESRDRDWNLRKRFSWQEVL